MLTIPLCALQVLVLASAIAGNVTIEPENLLRVDADLYSGGEPRGDAMFAALAQHGIRTAISVDGLAPDLESAKQFGIEYIHIPIGYDGIPAEAAAALAKVLRERPGPFYIHCHHGKHRGPAMAAIALRLQTGCNDETVRTWMERAGVSENYRGLWRDAIAFRAADVEGIEVELCAVSRVSDLAGTMAELDRVWERLKGLDAAEWQPLPEHPDVTPAHEALMLHEHFRKIARRTFDEHELMEFAQNLQEATDASGRLTKALHESNWNAATKALKRVRKSCKSCHQTWRD